MLYTETNWMKLVIGNKFGHVAQGFNQEESIDCDETYVAVARLEAIIMFIELSCYRNFKLFQMDVKSTLLNGYMMGKIYAKQPPNLKVLNFPIMCLNLKKKLIV